MDRRALISGCAAGFAFSANFTNHAPMIPALRGAFGFDQASAGLLTTSLFLTHAIMQIPGGRLADRYGAARVVVASLIWIALANFALATSQSYWQLLFWKGFAGIGTGVCFTAAARYIVGMFGGRDLHLGMGFYGGSVMLGSGFVLFAVPQLLAAFGWRGVSVGCALIAAAAGAWWIAAAPEPRYAMAAAASYRSMLRIGELWVLGVAQMASFGLMIVVGTWITLLLSSTFLMPLKTAGLVGSLVLLLGIVSRPLGGWLVPRLGVQPLVQGSLVVSAAACATLAWGGSTALALAAIVVLGIACGLPYAGIFDRAAARFPASAGAAMGLVNMVGIVMILAGAPAVGYLADWSGHFRTSFFALGAFELLAAAAAFAIPERK